MPPPPPRSILITGASSGIGKALAEIYAAPAIHLALCGRDRQRLEAVAAQCRAAGATITTGFIDVRAHDEMATWIHDVDRANPIDLAIASAGITTGIGLGRPREFPERVRDVIDINITGTVNTIEPVLDHMCMRGRGRVALMGSLAALRGLPYCPAYSASKAAIHAYAEALRGTLRRQGIGVTLIAPGFIATPMNRDQVAPKPLLMSVEHAARIIRRGLDRGSDLIAFPRSLYYGIHLMRLFPRRLTDAIFARVHVDVPE